MEEDLHVIAKTLVCMEDILTETFKKDINDWNYYHQIPDILGNIRSQLYEFDPLITDFFETKKRKRKADVVERVIDLHKDIIVDSNIRDGLRAIPQSSGEELIDFEKVPEALDKAFTEGDDALFFSAKKIVYFFNRVMFTGYMEDMPKNYLWEMSHRYQKLIVLSLCAEGRNLGSFDSSAEINSRDIPQALLHIAAYTYPSGHEAREFVETCVYEEITPQKTHDGLVKMLPEYVKVYLQSAKIMQKKKS